MASLSPIAKHSVFIFRLDSAATTGLIAASHFLHRMCKVAGKRRTALQRKRLFAQAPPRLGLRIATFGFFFSLSRSVVRDRNNRPVGSIKRGRYLECDAAADRSSLHRSVVHAAPLRGGLSLFTTLDFSADSVPSPC
jgi:hypothetical protein